MLCMAIYFGYLGFRMVNYLDDEHSSFQTVNDFQLSELNDFMIKDFKLMP